MPEEFRKRGGNRLRALQMQLVINTCHLSGLELEKPPPQKLLERHERGIAGAAANPG